MDLEELNKSQIVLLTILVSFVTSIATGIVTASLIERAPADVVRIMQRVVERVTPSTNSQQATVVTREKTVVVKETDLIASAIAKNESKIVSIVTGKDKKFISLGVFINTKGVVAMDASTLLSVKGSTYEIKVAKDTFIPATVTYAGGARGMSLLKTVTIDKKTKTEAKKPKADVSIRPITTTDAPLHLGQTVVAFLGTGSIAQGITTKLGNGGYIGTSINAGDIAPGALLINVNGDVVGISTGVSRKINVSTFAPIRTALAIESGTRNSATSTKKENIGTSTSTKTATTVDTSNSTVPKK